MNDLHEPEPIWPDTPRLCPDEPLPPYRFVPGLNPHPTEHPAGHSFGVEEQAAYVPPERWRENRPYLYGIDLYHRSYFWEAHEAWESIWKLVERSSVEGRFLQGLILNTAAQIKIHLNKPRGAQTLSDRSYALLRSVYDNGERRQFMGLELATLLAEMERHYGLLWELDVPQLSAVQGRPPRLLVAIESAP